MKSNNRWIIVLTVIIIGLVGCNIYLVVQNKNIHTNKEDNDVSEKPISNSSDNEEEKKEKNYDCSFTRTYRVVDLLEGYVAEVPEESYVVLDAFLDHGAFTHRISSELKKKLEVNKYYEFTYTLKGTTNNKINNIDDVLSYFSFNNAIRSDNRLKVLLEVKETDKLGMGQIQEDICKNK